MKNLKKVLALVVALTMVLGTVSFAFTDVDSENEVFTAVQTLSSLNILNGYEDGTFGAEKGITRAEFAAVVCRALGVNAAAQTATQFTDVPADHWASGYINYAAGLGIVNGYGDGKFGPEDNVTYEQAVKMLVVALGFEPMAAQKGGYPTGYLVIANQYGMTKGVANNGEASRGDVAQLVFNALDMPMMEQTGWGTNTSFDVQDGEGDRGYKTLLTELDVEKLDGVIETTPTIAGQVTDETVTYKIENIDAEKSYYKDTNGNIIAARNPANLYIAEGVNVNEYFGMASTVYAKEFQKGKFEIIAIMPGAASEVIELTVGDLAENIANNEIKYYESDAATKATTKKLDASVKVLFNNSYKNAAGAAYTVADINTWKADPAKEDITLQLINNNDDSDFEMIIAKQYTYDIVKEVEADRSRLTLEKAVNTLRFDFEDEDVINTLLDEEGNEITLADFAEGDVVAFMKQGNAFSGFGWIEVINLGQNVVEGTVDGKNVADSKVTVDGVSYEVLSVAGTIEVADEGTFYLTREGKIFHKDTSASISSNYAFVLDADYNSQAGFNKVWQLQLLTKDGSVTIYNTKDSFKLYDNAANSAGTTIDNSATSAGTIPTNFTQVSRANNTHDVNPTVRLVTYKLDGNNAIKEIRFLAPSAQEQFTDKEFKADAQTIDGKPIENNAVIFNVSDSSVDNVKALDVNSLVDETEYSGYVYKVDANTDYTCVVITDGAAAIDYTQDLAVVESISKGQDDEGNDVVEVLYYASNEETAKKLIVDDEAKVNGSTSNADAIGKGDIIMFAAGAEGDATDVVIVADYNDVAKQYVVDASVTSDGIDTDDDLGFYYGYINDWRSANSGRALKLAGATRYDSTTPAGTATTDEIVIKSGVNAYTFVNNSNLSRSYIAVGDWQADEGVDKKTDNIASDGSTVLSSNYTYIFAKVYNGVVTDIVVLGDAIVQ